MSKAVVIREARFPDDAQDIVRIDNEYDSEPSTPEEYLRYHDSWQPTDPRFKQVAVVEGKTIGFVHTRRRGTMTPGVFFLSVCVQRSSLKLGAGRALAAAGEEFAWQSGATSVTAFVPESDPVGRGFAERRGFAQSRHLFESVLNVDDVSEAVIESDTVGCAERAGIRFTTLAELGHTKEAEELLYELGAECDLDEPGQQEYGQLSREDYQRQVFEAPWFRAEGAILALDGDRWVGVHLTGPLVGSDVADFTVDFTGVRRDYRGQGVARALKLLGVRYARAMGGTRIITHNDSTNASMLAVNQRLGYQPRPGFLMMKKQRP